MSGIIGLYGISILIIQFFIETKEAAPTVNKSSFFTMTLTILVVYNLFDGCNSH